MAKSLEEVMRQLEAQREAQRIAEQQRRLAEERTINEQREIQRRFHLERIRMYEASVNFNNASSSAAGAGGSLKKDCSLNNYVESDYICDYFE